VYGYFVSQFSEFCRHNLLCCFSTSGCFCSFFVTDTIRKILSTLSYADSISILGENVNTLKKDTEALLEASREVSPEVHRENEAYIHVSPPKCRAES
jgi:hypothetical protein